MFERFEKESIIFNREILRDLKPVYLVHPPATIKILIVADGSIGFSGNNFTLQKVIEVLENEQHQDFPTYARFDVTTAHRANGAGADISEFEFTSNSLNDYDELWLFGISGGNFNAANERETYLSAQELDVIADFMQAGGGVIAMGDHQDLGLGLCAGVPRVRNMRKWWYTGNIPAGQQKAPGTSADRIDTVQPSGIGSGSQSDNTPQPIIYKPYYKYRGLGLRPAFRPFRRRYSKYPHPVLCGPLGAITIFPDHQHEGECVLPSDYSLKISTSAGDVDEYPGGVKPELIAYGRDLAHASKKFGLLGVYDGHDVKDDCIGRVLVDGTWHHWFNVNLTGFYNDQKPDGSETDDWRQIQAFFRNCAIWLAPKAKQHLMRIAGNRVIFNLYPIAKDFHAWREELRLKPSAQVYYKAGRYSLDALERVTTRCGRYVWLYDFFRAYELEKLVRFDPEVIKRIRPIPMPDPSPEFDELRFFAKDEPDAIRCDLIEDSALVTAFGAAMLEFWAVVEKLESDKGFRGMEPEERLEQMFESSIKPIRKAVEKALPVAKEFTELRVKTEVDSLDLLKKSLADNFR